MAAASCLRAHLVSLSAAGAIVALLLLPASALAPLPLESIALPVDKLVHFAIFLLPASSWRRSIAALGSRRPGAATWAAATIFAGALEIAQGLLVRDRSAELLDLVSGSLGAAAGLWHARGTGRRPASSP